MSKAIRETVAKEYPDVDARYSHVAIIDGDNVLEPNPKEGVTLTPLKKFKRIYPIYEIRELPGDISKARARIGKPYDFEGMVGMFINNHDIQRPEADFCSELVGIAADEVDDSEAHKLPTGYFVSITREIVK